MKVTGIIAEYNPLHCGHLYHMEQSVKQTEADYIIVVMSGDYVQRGEPALLDKYVRARMALLAGADLVLELPFPFCCSSAEDFASWAVGILDSLGVVTHLSFGSEAGQAGPLLDAAKLLADEPEEYRQALKSALAKGSSFAAARQEAFQACPSREELPVFSSPNNILGVEYLKALLCLHSPIVPVTVRRAGDGYHETRIGSGAYPSATALRRLIRAGELQSLEGLVPEAVLPLLLRGRFLFPEDLSPILNYRILTALSGGYERYAGFSRELEGRLRASAFEALPWEERIFRLKTKNYTYARISRALLSLVLDLTARETEEWRGKEVLFSRILGFRKSAAPLLSAVKANSSIPIIAKMADGERLLSGPALSMFQKGVTASHIRQAAEAGKYGTDMIHEYRRQLIIL